jgi:hypothetical protein
MPSKTVENTKKVRSSSAVKRKDAAKLEKWSNSQPDEKLNDLSIVKSHSDYTHQDIQNAIELEKIGIPIEVVEEIDASLAPPKLLREKAREILYPEVAKGKPTREELIRQRLHLFEVVKDEPDQKRQ